MSYIPQEVDEMRLNSELQRFSQKLEPFLDEPEQLLKELLCRQSHKIWIDEHGEQIKETNAAWQLRFLRIMKHVAARVGYPVLAKVLTYFYKYPRYELESWDAVELGKIIRAGHEQLVYEVSDFVFALPYTQGSFRLISYIEGTVKFGLDEIKRGMDLAPPPSPTSRHGVLPEYHRPEREYHEDRYWWGYHTAELGYQLISKLTKRYRDEGLNENTIRHFFYQAEYANHLGKPRWQWSLDVIDLIKSNGLEPKGFAEAVFDLIVGRRATIKEITTILQLAQKNRIRAIDRQELENAIETWRSPDQQDFVTEAFELGAPYALSRAKFGISLGLGFAIAFGADIDQIGLNLFRGFREDAKVSTQEILKPRYPKMGIFGFEQQMIPELATNPLIVPAMLKPLAKAKTIPELETVYGSDWIREAMRFAADSSEIECRTAIQLVGPKNSSS